MGSKRNLMSFSQQDLKLLKREILKTADVDLFINRIDNEIDNLQELLDIDSNTLRGLTDSSREYIDWARHFYDMNNLTKPSHVKKKELTNKNNM